MRKLRVQRLSNQKRALQMRGMLLDVGHLLNASHAAFDAAPHEPQLTRVVRCTLQLAIAVSSASRGRSRMHCACEFTECRGVGCTLAPPGMKISCPRSTGTSAFQSAEDRRRRITITSERGWVTRLIASEEKFSRQNEWGTAYWSSRARILPSRRAR